MWLPIIILSFMLFLLDLYVYRGLSFVFEDLSGPISTWWRVLYWLISGVTLIGLIYVMFNFETFREDQPRLYMFFVALFWVFLFPKLTVGTFLFIDDVGQLLQWTYKKTISPEHDVSRRNFMTRIGTVIAGLTVGSMLYGVTKGKFAFRVLSERIDSPRFPSSFDGLRIVQLSDAHLGSFAGNQKPIMRMVEMVNDLEPDYILFTGDLVNSHAKEAEGWEPVFAALKAKEGKYSVLGNHDYARYFQGTEAEREDSMRRLKEVHRKMGFRLMEDEHVRIERNGEYISLLGVHNWGPGFGEYGDIDKAMSGVYEEDFKILMSHDPSHFEQKVLGKKSVDLTLSGHTHGCQMGIEIPSLGIKWSPVSIRYKRWGGLYREGDQYLYVNRGMGVLAMPGRVGMPPEITCLDLYST